MAEAKTKKKESGLKETDLKETDFNLNPEEMAQAGLHFGHKTSKVHPKMKPYISGVRNTIHIIDLEKTAEKLKEALKFIQGTIVENKSLLIVGTKVQVKDLVENMTKECGLPYVVERWLGGTFTNFDTIKKRIDYFKNLEKRKEAGELEKYTKKEKAGFDEELRKLNIKFRGIRNLEKLPDVIFVCDLRKDSLAIREAKQKGIKTVGIAHTNVDPNLVDYAIPANDDAISSVKYILDKVKEATLSVKLKIQSTKSKTV